MLNKESNRNALNLPDKKLRKIGERCFGVLARNVEFENLNLLKIRETRWAAGSRRFGCGRQPQSCRNCFENWFKGFV